MIKLSGVLSLSKGKDRLSVRCWSIVILLLLVFFAQLAFSARQLSLTSDEPPNLGVGYTYLATGETWHIAALGNPPLPFAWMALPVVLGNPNIPLQTLPNWHTLVLPPYFRALFPLLGPVEQLEVVGRVPMMLLGLLLGSLVFRWAADLFGAKGGILALALMVFDPAILAHTPLATADVAVTLLGFATFFVGWRWARASRTTTEGLRWGIGIGLLAGATMATKASGPIWVGLVVGLIAMVEVVRSPGKKPSFSEKARVLVRRMMVILVTAFLFLWGIYGFRLGPVRVGPYLLTMPASHHWETLMRTLGSSSTRLMFLAGETKVGGGWWWYFPFAFLIKNPIPLLLIWTEAIVISLRRRFPISTLHSPFSNLHSPTSILDLLFLLAFPVVYVAVAIYGGINIGYRHLLPIHPFLYVLAADLTGFGKPVRSGGKTRFLRVLWVVLWIWYVVGTMRIFPNYLAYFNELVGGPSNGYRYLVDSNLDWGQNFKTLKKDLDHLDIRPPLRLGHDWYAGPELYGMQYEPIPPLVDDVSTFFSPRFDPPPGTYVLGATLLQCGYGDLEQYEWFRNHTPLAQSGYGLFVYRVDPHQPPATWVAQCTRPAPPLEDELLSREFHTQPLRRVFFDCTQSWVYPAFIPPNGVHPTSIPPKVGGDRGGAESGWYALHDQVLQEDSPFLQRHLDQTHLAYVHHQYDAMAPAFRLYEFRPSMQALGYTQSVRVAPPGMGPRQVVAERPVVTAPLSLEGPLVFLGYRLLDVGAEAVTLETWWEVTEQCPEPAEGLRPLSIMAHLVDGEGRAVAVADGLGVPLEVWQVGDVVVQYHDLSLTPDLEGEVYWLQTGVYWLDTMERWPVLADGVGDRVILTSVELSRR